ncbi:MAG: tryptophan synthase subunit alpha [Planctomycetes bacterium]|nr:tryptophan synthase subunit alpha [Planctomycetota bacterium]
MNRIERIFRDLKSRGGRALMPFITAGDPDLDTTAAMLPRVEEAGASICELGIPFSDPIADGPVIQASMAYALSKHLRTADILAMTRRLRPRLNMGVVAMVSYSIVHRAGPRRFVADAAAAGFDGFIFPDLPLEESDAILGSVRDAGLTCTLLIAPTTPIERAEKIARASSGFVYVLSRSGITGERASLPADLAQRVQRLRGVTDLPITVGFGVSTPDQVRCVVEVADAVIVGSAIMRRVADVREQGRERVVDEVSRFVSELAAGLPGSAVAR